MYFKCLFKDTDDAGRAAQRISAEVLERTGRSSGMRYRAQPVTNEADADPYSSSSLVPMLVAGLVLTFLGMIVAVILT